MNTAPLLQVQDISKTFPKPDGEGQHVVLQGVNLTINEGEIVGLLGRSGSGKSTLLRCIAGLSEPSGGAISYLGSPVDGPAEGISMVFQSFAIFPWLTVYENVALGLEALRTPLPEIRRRSLEAIDLIGLDGFESAYPRELSGGMRQRVGFARALVVHPNILLMDEPFSALDVLTAETLRTDFLDLWTEGRMPIKGVILVTHNIEEAVLMCDRILVFASNPGRILTEIRVTLPQPRNRLDPSFRALVESIYVVMTARPSADTHSRAERFPGLGIGTQLPHVSSNLLAGLMETVATAPFFGTADLPKIASDLQMEIDDLFPVAETLQMMRFAEVAGGDIRLTEVGNVFANSELDERKRIFARQLLNYVPLAAHIRRVLDERPSHTARKSRFSDELEDHMSEDAAEQTLRAMISWGRYAEAFAYDDENASFGRGQHWSHGHAVQSFRADAHATAGAAPGRTARGAGSARSAARRTHAGRPQTTAGSAFPAALHTQAALDAASGNPAALAADAGNTRQVLIRERRAAGRSAGRSLGRSRCAISQTGLVSGRDAMGNFHRAGYGFLPVAAEHVAAVETLRDHRRDPFDRILVAGALIEPMRLMTHDPLVARYSDTILEV